MEYKTFLLYCVQKNWFTLFFSVDNQSDVGYHFFDYIKAEIITKMLVVGYIQDDDIDLFADFQASHTVCATYGVCGIYGYDCDCF